MSMWEDSLGLDDGIGDTSAHGVDDGMLAGMCGRWNLTP